MIPDQRKNFEAVLVANLSRAIDWIKFAEAKNAALVTLASAWMLAAATLSANAVANAVPELVGALTRGVPLMFISGAIAFASFFPDLNLSARFKRQPNPKSNFLFYEHLKTIQPARALSTLEGAYLDADDPGLLSRRYYDDLAVQIVVNSAIASRKFKMFRAALGFAGAAFVIFLYHFTIYLF